MLPTAETVLANATLVLPGEIRVGSVRIAGGRIDAIDTGAAVPAGALDCGADLVMPGLIELHTDNLERHIQPRPAVDWPHASAIIAHDAELAGVGITTVFDAMRVGSVPSRRARYRPYARGLASELLELRAGGALRISHFLHLRAEICSETLPEEMAAFGPEDRVGIVSLMDHTPGQRQFRDEARLKAYMMGKNNFTEAEFRDHVASLKDLRAQNGARHEVLALAEARRFGAILASHDDTTAAHVAVSAGQGIRLAEFPTTLEAAEACRAEGIAVMMGAPNLIRGGSHSGNVAAADLAGPGLLDILSSDYVPSALLVGALRLGDLWGDLARGIATVTQAPADAVGLADRGRIVPGARADLIRVARIGGAPVVRGAWVQGARVA
ncbi:phosphonate metabolism protein PhnM [Rhodovulum sulfidophilum]|uniref:Phosphonate metabolism protein PhnM n=1 Tax=Rhodovulum sulfidophilum TaxID=35806 RepID=A0A0D6B525_RHOSU|nr:phosphonate metabolism protein PhnM [Rhodovulum sulfidophilum]